MGFQFLTQYSRLSYCKFKPQQDKLAKSKWNLLVPSPLLSTLAKLRPVLMTLKLLRKPWLPSLMSLIGYSVIKSRLLLIISMSMDAGVTLMMTTAVVKLNQLTTSIVYAKFYMMGMTVLCLMLKMTVPLVLLGKFPTKLVSVDLRKLSLKNAPTKTRPTNALNTLAPSKEPLLPTCFLCSLPLPVERSTILTGNLLVLT